MGRAEQTSPAAERSAHEPPVPGKRRFADLSAVNPELVTKAGLALGLVCFLAGWLVQSAYLYSFGFTVGDLTSLRAQLVVVGGLFLGLMVISVLCAVGTVQVLRSAFITKPRKLQDLLTLPMVVGAPIVLFKLIGGGDTDSASWETSLKAVALAMVTGFLLAGIKLARRVVVEDATWAAFLVIFALFTVFYFFWYASYYANNIYPTVPEEFGGAKPVRAWLQIKDATTAQGLAEAGIPFQPTPAGSQRTRPLDLLYDDGNILVVRTKVGDVIRIERDATIAVQIDSHRPRARSLGAVNAGTRTGIPEQGDSFELTYSKPMDPGSIVPGWDGRLANVVVSMQQRAPIFVGTRWQAEFDLTLKSAHGAPVAIGRVLLYADTRHAAQTLTWGSTGAPSTIVATGAQFVVTLGSPSDPWTAGPVGNRPRWEPATSATDDGGLECEPTVVVAEPSGTRPPLF